jgi:hypothetical protein
LAIISIFLIPIASCSLDSSNTGLSPIPLDLKVSGSTDDGAIAPEDNGADVVTNRKNVLSKDSSLQQVAYEDVAPAPRPNIILMMTTWAI